MSAPAAGVMVAEGAEEGELGDGLSERSCGAMTEASAGSEPSLTASQLYSLEEAIVKMHSSLIRLEQRAGSPTLSGVAHAPSHAPGGAYEPGASPSSAPAAPAGALTRLSALEEQMASLLAERRDTEVLL